MAVTDTDTVLELVTDALRIAGVVAVDLAASTEEVDIAVRELNRMVKSWQAAGHNLWTVSSQTVTLTTSASYTLNPARPIQIHNVRLNRSGREIPMWEMTREEYDTLPVKTSTGVPTSFYYDKQREAALLYVWPVLAAANGETLEITYNREVEDMASADEVDFPAEWYDAVVYGLADRMTFLFPADNANPMLASRASAAFEAALAGDREQSVFFGDAC